MRYQTDTYSCGAAAVVNALRALGKRISERRVRALSGTDPDRGTGESGIVTAVRGLGFSATAFESSNSQEAWSWISENVRSGRAVIVAVWNHEHWMTVVGMVGDRTIMFDSARTEKNKKENGVHSLSRGDFLRKWRHSVKDVYFGISVSKR